MRYRWKALGELFRSYKVASEVTGVPEKLCFAESREGDSATLRTVTRPHSGALSSRSRSLALGACVSASGFFPTRGLLASACRHSTWPTSRHKICPQRACSDTMLCTVGDAGEDHQRGATDRYSHQPPRARHGARCLFSHVRPKSSLIRPDTRLYSLHVRRKMCLRTAHVLLLPLSSAPCLLALCAGGRELKWWAWPRSPSGRAAGRGGRHRRQSFWQRGVWEAVWRLPGCVQILRLIVSRYVRAGPQCVCLVCLAVQRAAGAAEKSENREWPVCEVLRSQLLRTLERECDAQICQGILCVFGV